MHNLLFLPSPVEFVHPKAARSSLVMLSLGWARGLQHPPLMLPYLVGCYVVIHCPLLSLHTVMQPSMLLLPAAFAANCCPPPPTPPLPLPPGHHHCHRHHSGRTHHCLLPKKLATAAAPPAYQQHTNLKTFTCPDDLDLFYLPTVFPPLGVCTTVSVRTTVSTICQ
jgi:hypothetical protein